MILIIIIPLPLFFTSHIYSIPDFKAWVAVAFMWLTYGVGAVVLYPVWESRTAIGFIGKSLVRDLFGGGVGKKESGPA